MFNSLVRLTQSLGYWEDLRLGQHFHEVEHDVATAKQYYLRAAEQGKAEAFHALSRLAHEVGESKESLYYSGKYHALLKEEEAAIDAYKQAALAGYAPALEALRLLSANASKAALALGHVYEVGHDSQKAGHYYARAAQQGDTIGLTALARLVDTTYDKDLRLALGALYRTPFNDPLSAFQCYQLLVDQGYTPAFEPFEALVHQEAVCARALAEGYHTADPTHPSQYYYTQAFQADAQTAQAVLSPLAEAGEAEAQYALGFGVYHQQAHVESAIHWCLKAAEQQHPKALAYFKYARFTAEQYSLIARCYEQGEGVQKHLPSALTFYQKACALQHPEAAYRLGQLYQLEEGHNGLGVDAEKASHYFIQAVQWGHPDALIPLQRLRDEVSFKTLITLGKFYLNLPFSDRVNALACFEQAAAGGESEAHTNLEALHSDLNQDSNPRSTPLRR